MTQSGARISTLVGGLLDAGYDRAAGATLRAVASSLDSGIVAQRLAELDAESARLAHAGQRLQPDNPVLRALLADLEPVLRQNAGRITQGASAAQASGVSAAAQLVPQLALDGVPVPIRAAWNVPDPDAVNALVGYVNAAGWAQDVGRYPVDVLRAVQHQAILGMVEGWGAARTAREIRRIAQGLPVAQANTLMRTTQLQSFRDASAIHQQANADLLTGQIRIAALDDRTCLACIALHGEKLPVGVRVEDHHNGRCTSIAVVRGRARQIPTGEQWFNSLDEARQRRIAGAGAFEALKSGKAALRDFVQPYQDRTFGQMIRQGSLKDVLGDARRGGSPPAPTAPQRSLPAWDESDPVRRLLVMLPRQTQVEQAWADSLTAEQKEALSVYTGGGYQTINKVVRGQPLPDGVSRSRYAGFEAKLREALETAPTVSMVTWRGISLDEEAREALIKRYRRQVGTVIVWDGYASTSLNPRVARDFAGRDGLMYEIRSTRGRWIEAASQHGYESEVLLTPGAELQIVEVKEIAYYNDRRNTIERRTVVVVDDVTE